MADVTINTVLDGNHEPRVGDRYEIAPGRWFVMKAPTVKLQKEFYALMDKVNEAVEADDGENEYNGPGDMDVLKLVMEGDFDFDQDNVITGVSRKAVSDFFTLLSLINKKLMPEFEPSGQQPNQTQA